MADVKALRNISNRPLELCFDGSSERIAPGTTGKYHTEGEWNSLAQKQADVFVNRHEARFIVKDERKVTVEDLYLKPKETVVQEAESDAGNKTTKKGDK